MNFFKSIFNWLYNIVLFFIHWGSLFIFVMLPLGVIGALFYQLIGPTTELGISLMGILALVTGWFLTTKTSIGGKYVDFIEKTSQYFDNLYKK